MHINLHNQLTHTVGMIHLLLQHLHSCCHGNNEPKQGLKPMWSVVLPLMNETTGV